MALRVQIAGVWLLAALLCFMFAACYGAALPEAPVLGAGGHHLFPSSDPLTESTGETVENKSCSAFQVHMALTGDETEMLISWATTKEGCSSKVKLARALGEDSESDDSMLEVDGNTYGLHANTGCDLHSPTSLESKKIHLHLHNAVLTGLEPGARYTYSLGDGGFSGTFTAAPKPNPEASFTFLAYGDMGEPEDGSAKSPNSGITSSLIKEEVAAGGVSMIFHVGDLAYAHGKTHVWDTFMEQIEPMASAIPYMVSVGNYEYDYKGHSKDDPSGAKKAFRPSWWNGQNDSGGECGLPCAMRFQMPGQRGTGALHGTFSSLGNAAVPAASGAGASQGGARGNAPFWYNFAYQSVHFIVLSGEHDFRKGSDQYTWLKSLLESGEVNRETTPWLIVGIHRPLYVPFPHGSNRKVAFHMRKSLEPLFNEHKVDVVVSGHVHSYTRSCPVFNWDCITGPKDAKGRLTRKTSSWTWPSVLRLPSRAENSGFAKHLVPSVGADDDDEHDMCHEEHDSPTSGGDYSGATAEYNGEQDDMLERWGNHSSASDANHQQSGNGNGYGTTHLVMGTGGHKLSGLSKKQPAWVVANAVTPGYGRFRVEGSNRIVFEFVDAFEKRVTDSVEITKPK